MATTVKTEIRPAYFYVQVAGEFEFLQSMVRIPHILVEFAESHRQQILMDVRGVTGPVTILERMDYYSNFTHRLKELEQQRSIKNPRVAWLVPPHWIGAGPGGELVERAGYEYFRTDEPVLVLKWLGVEPNAEGLEQP